jgi:hypothetical protein
MLMLLQFLRVKFSIHALSYVFEEGSTFPFHTVGFYFYSEHQGKLPSQISFAAQGA